jgi:hypothetical protein
MLAISVLWSSFWASDLVSSYLFKIGLRIWFFGGFEKPLVKARFLLTWLAKTTRKEESVSEITLDLRLVFKIPKKGLRINGLIQGLKESSPKIHETILTTLMQALEEQVIETILQEDPQRFKRNGHQNKPRCLRCSLGKISYRMAQLMDLKTGKTFQPLRKALAIPAHDHYLEEALESSMGLVMHVSYRRSVNEVERIQGQSPAHTTLHTRLQEFAQNHEPFGNLKNKPFRYLLADGTKVHLQGYRGQDLGQVEMRWALASLGSLAPFEPVGFWIDTDWKTIRQDLNQRLDYKKLKFLFSDGGPGISENLLASWMKPQRCLWHGKREFLPALRRWGEETKAEALPRKNAIHPGFPFYPTSDGTTSA